MEKTIQPHSRVELLLNRLVQEITSTNKKLDSIIKLNSKTENSHPNLKENILQPDVMSLLSLPASLRKTVMALYKLEKATAQDISQETKRLRAVESAAANQLVRMGYIKKKREGRDVYFYIESQNNGNKQWEEQ